MNTDTITLSLPYIITIGISSGLFAGLVSTIGNILIAYFNQKNERSVETEKYNNSINDYRYKEIHNYLNILCDLPSKVYVIQSHEDMLKLVESSNNEYEIVMSVYRKAIPLLDISIQELISNVNNEVKKMSSTLVTQAYTTTENKYNVTDLVTARDRFKDSLIKALQDQLMILIYYRKRSTIRNKSIK